MKQIFSTTILISVSYLLATNFVNAETTLDKNAGRKSYQTYCEMCHNGTLPESPKLSALKLYPPERIVGSLESGIMSTQGMQLSRHEKIELAYFITGKKLGTQSSTTLTMCKDVSIAKPNSVSPALWKGWGNGYTNNRYQGKDNTFTPTNVNDLALAWTFAFPDATRSRAQPLVGADFTYIGSQSGDIYALDTDTGCIHWRFQAKAEARGAMHLQKDPQSERKLLLFGDIQANVYALDAHSGKAVWQKNVGYHPINTITGSVTATDSQVFVPMSSLEIIPAAREDYECCTFRGGLIALDLQSGATNWTSFTTEPPQLVGKNSLGTLQFAPSGAPIWSSPTLDIERGLIYVTTGQNYSSPSSNTSDAIIAIDMKDGQHKWVTQVLKGDAWNGACVRKRANCPEENGPDFDIGASAILATDKEGRDWIVAGQKSGMVYGLDPQDNGKIVWKTRVGSGGTMGGVHWGMSTNGEKVYVGVSDLPTNNPGQVGDPNPGVSALNIQSGERVWHYTPKNVCDKDEKFRCYHGISASVSSSPGLVYAGGLDGMLHILNAESGDPLWSFNTKRQFPNVNGVQGFGGAIEADGPVIADGKLFVTSGYDKWGQSPGNMLLVFSLDAKQTMVSGDKQ